MKMDKSNKSKREISFILYIFFHGSLQNFTAVFRSGMHCH